MADVPSTINASIWDDTTTYSAIVNATGLHTITDTGSVVNVEDRAARLLGVIYGSQGQQLKQTATNYNTQVELATGATLYDARQIRALTTADAINVGQWLGSTAPTVGQKTSVNSIPVVMASDQTGVSTKTELQTLAEAGKVFSIQGAFVTISGSSETDFMLFRNPTGSGKIVEFSKFFYTYTKGSAIALMRMYQAPTVTSVGAAITINKMNLGGAISPVALVYQTPTISNRGALRRVVGNSSVQTFIFERDLAFIIPANTDILITITPASNNTDHSVGIEWAEE
jgi:hypothetical protein